VKNKILFMILLLIIMTVLYFLTRSLTPTVVDMKLILIDFTKMLLIYFLGFALIMILPNNKFRFKNPSLFLLLFSLLILSINTYAILSKSYLYLIEPKGVNWIWHIYFLKESVTVITLIAGFALAVSFYKTQKIKQ
jgi:hypothetical protein